MTHDLLHEPLIQTDRGWHSLPGLLAAMARGEVQGFPALRPHQRPAWHMLLVQLAVLALDAAGRRDLPLAEEDWRTALRGLTATFPGNEPWHLLGADCRLPAFLQPPDPGGLKWSGVATPDALDMLITSRNHDIKREIARQAAPQDWIFALVSLQTMEGFGGRDNYGIARMNGGYSSRVLLGLAPARAGSAQVDPSAWWARDVTRLLASRQGLEGKALLWLEPWPEGRSLELAALDPLFIEICRRVRLVQINNRIIAERSTSLAARVAAKEAKGNTKDPWAPINTKTESSFHLGEQDWTPKVLVQIMFSNPKQYHLPPLTLAHGLEASQPMVLVAEGFARGQSKTDGFKSRIVPVPKVMLRQLFGEKPASVADGILKDIAAVGDCLTHALRLVACGGDSEKLAKAKKSPKTREKIDSYAGPARATLRRKADEWFFPELWLRMEAKVDADFAPLHLAFLERLAAQARAEFREALPGMPCASLMRPRAEVRGWQALERGLHFAMRDYRQEKADA